MLELKEIKKDYYAGGTTVNALKNVNLSFRKCEFVSILGPSGCGKTTLLNIIGGLDHYSSGDLIIDNVSTKSYSDRDWDTYRNHRVGFVFQSYNLIPHQTILENVALALNISGVNKKQRTIKAKQALDKVGLKNQYNKKPNQLSGGQCQRVAIARALVNDPEILLADEPTGALDSETSVQIMNLIQEVAKECLVIMVTHNPELAKQYSTRIINLLDGDVVSDSNPYDETIEKFNEKNNKNLPKKTKPNKKAKLSFWSAFKLSAKNLWSKFKRTFMVCVAGSIGIIGVATVLAVSSGVQGYISSMQNDMLSGNPISISEETINLNALVSSSSTFMKTDAVKNSTENGFVYVDSVIDYLVSRSGDISSLKVSNNITQNYVDFVYQMPKEYYNAIVSYYGIDIANNIYTDFNFHGQTNNNLSLTAGTEIYTALLNKTDYSSFSQYISTLSDCFLQSPDSEEFILSQYDIISNKETSHIAKNSNEIMIVVSDETTLSDLLLAQLGYFSQDEFFNIVYKATDDSENYDEELWKDKFSYDSLMEKTFYYYPNDTVFNKTPEDSPLFASNPFTYNPFRQSSWENGKELKITAILRPKEGVSYGCLESGVYYTKALAEEIIETNTSSEIVQYLLNKNEDERSFTSTQISGVNVGITYSYSYKLKKDDDLSTSVGFVGSVSQTSALIGSMTGQTMPTYHILSLRELGGVSLPNKIEIYPTDFNFKDDVTAYLTTWNEAGDILVNGVTLTEDDREEITYTDNLSIVISLVNNLVNIVTTALVAFTALSLVVSTVMVAIITYVSVMERVKEIGVIRSMGGRKRDISNLFIAETFIIGGVSGVFGILITYLLSGLINLIVGNLVGIYTIASLSPTTALIMILISIVLTLISGLIPARLAAKKDPVVALRSE